LQEQFSFSQIKKVDSGQVYRAYRDWSALAEAGFKVKFDITEGEFKRAFVLGMGGSAAGGDIIAGWLSLRRDIEFSVLKGTIPFSDSKGALAIACSASGQTEETVAMMKTAARGKATVVCISAGGRLEVEAKALGLRHVRMPKVVAPRYMLPFIVFSCLAVANKALGLDCEREAQESIAAMKAQSKSLDIEASFSDNASMQLAEKLLPKTPAILGDRVTRGVGVRFKNALNENAKKHAYFDMMPDLFHNEIQAWEGPEESFLPIFLRHSREDPYDGGRADAMSRILDGLGKTPVEVRGSGTGVLSQLMTMVYYLDMASYYAAIGLGKDPLPTQLVDRLKKAT
jgi:glucose/mannose-6-phosphate isomerase